MHLFDTHCHFDYPPLFEHARKIIGDCAVSGIREWLVPGTTFDRFAHLCAFVDTHPEMHLALGLHPVYLDEHLPEHLEALPEWIARHKPVAVGEFGLDYYLEHLDREAQQALFEAQLHIASSHALPVVLHVRRAHDAVIKTLKALSFQEGGIVHAWAGSAEQAREFLKLGFCLGFGGALTYSGSKRIRRVAADLPLEAIVLETDAPDMKPADWPAPHNSPTSLSRGFASLCELRGESAEEIAAQTTANARRIFRLKS